MTTAAPRIIATPIADAPVAVRFAAARNAALMAVTATDLCADTALDVAYALAGAADVADAANDTWATSTYYYAEAAKEATTVAAEARDRAYEALEQVETANTAENPMLMATALTEVYVAVARVAGQCLLVIDYEDYAQEQPYNHDKPLISLSLLEDAADAAEDTRQYANTVYNLAQMFARMQ